MIKTKSGFTIVELLIVIVVIAILAAITVVAYNGIQTRAENTKTIQAVAQYVKAIHGYAAINGNYPIETGYPCLGPIGTACGRISGPTNCLGTGPATAQTTFDTNIKTVISGNLPVPSDQTMNCGGNQFGGGYYIPTTGKTATIIYFLRDDQLCGGVGGITQFSKTQQDETTRCQADFSYITIN